MEKIRFAPIIRVSTEKQKEKGSSLGTQKAQIIQYVQSLNRDNVECTIPEECWKYSGQEHATSGYERKLLDQLLEDAPKGFFDAVICCDASRWSRDNRKSKEGLEILKANKIRFFVGTMEYNLYNPGQNLFLGMSAEIGEYHANEQSSKSIINRINNAKKGKPSAGKLPYGRTWNNVTMQWGIDEDKQKLIEDAADSYLKGESIPKIAKRLGVNASTLWKDLNHRSGDVWEINFESKKLNINETVQLKVPRLLPEETITAIKAKGDANRTYQHGVIKHKYLLNRMMFCTKCGYTLDPFTNKYGTQYYVHKIKQDRVIKCKNTKFVKAVDIEPAVLLHLIRTFGDKEKIQNAIDLATPNVDRRKKLQYQIKYYMKQLKKIDEQRERLVDFIAAGALAKDDAKKKFEKLDAQESQLKQYINTNTSELEALPNVEKVKKLSEIAIKVLKNSSQQNPMLLFKRSYEWKRKLVESAFAGLDSKGKRYGVYVTQLEDETFRYELRGNFESTVLNLPLDDDYLEDTFHLDPRNPETKEKIKEIRKGITSFSSY